VSSRTDHDSSGVLSTHVARDSITRRLALAKVQELRRTGAAYREIARRFAPPSGSPESAHPANRPTGTVTSLPACVGSAAPRRIPNARPFLRALDAVEQALGFYDGTSKLVHANRLLRDQLAAPRTGEQLVRELGVFVKHAFALVRVRRLGGEEHVVEDLTIQEVPLPADETCSVRLRASFIGFDLFTVGPTLLVTVQTAGPAPLSDDSLRTRFALTRQESRIARLIARGLRNADIACELSISPHTVRRHTESVFGKLRVTSRGEVHGRLLWG
jgi:DNA-binding CsgD family transcriptional regulator